MLELIKKNFTSKFTAEFILQIVIKIIIILIILVLARLIFIALRRGIDRMEDKGFLRPPLVTAVKLTLRWFIIIIATIIILSQLGFSMQSIWAVLSAVLAMVAVGFVAFWSSLSNILSTFLLLIFQPFQIGDEIEIMEPTGSTGLRGRVINLDFMFTIIEQKVNEKPIDGEKSTDSASIKTGSWENDQQNKIVPGKEQIVQVRIPNNMLFQKSIRTFANKKQINLRDQLFTEKSLVD